MKTCYIFAAGSFFGVDTRPKENDVVIAADGGLCACKKENIVPDIILGDFDSLGYIPNGENVIVVPKEKDDTDTLLAVKKGIERGADRFKIFGGTGGRLDHTIANLQALLYIRSRGLCGYLYDEEFVYTAIKNESITLEGKEGNIFSVFCFGATARGVNVKNAKYEVEDAEISADFPLGISNAFTKKPLEISVSDGSLIICIQKNRA